MQPIRDEEDDILARLETRFASVSTVVSRLKDRNAELESQFRDALAAKDDAEAQMKAARQEAEQLKEEVATLRSRHKQAATRIKSLLSQVEQMDLLTEG